MSADFIRIAGPMWVTVAVVYVLTIPFISAEGGLRFFTVLFGVPLLIATVVVAVVVAS